MLGIYISRVMKSSREEQFDNVLLISKLLSSDHCVLLQVLSFQARKTPAEKSYVSALCRILVSLNFRLSEQGAIKLLKRLLNCLSESVLAEKDLTKELKRMSEHLKGLDRHPDQDLSEDEVKFIFGKFLNSCG